MGLVMYDRKYTLFFQGVNVYFMCNIADLMDTIVTGDDWHWLSPIDVNLKFIF